MARIKKADTQPEVILRTALRKLGVRPGHGRGLPGTPDLVFRRARVAVFVHGCFFHGCPRHYRQPLTRLEYWIPKLSRNQRRDRRVARSLRANGWSVLTIWECQAKADPERAALRVVRTIAKKRVGARAPANRSSPIHKELARTLPKKSARKAVRGTRPVVAGKTTRQLN